MAPTLSRAFVINSVNFTVYECASRILAEL
jgi:hypothetical protein